MKENNIINQIEDIACRKGLSPQLNEIEKTKDEIDGLEESLKELIESLDEDSLNDFQNEKIKLEIKKIKGMIEAKKQKLDWLTNES